ncbi:hypothetical protein ACI65C_000065 [Semiaphis heraclei]
MGFFFFRFAGGVGREGRWGGYWLKWILTGVAHGAPAKGNQTNVCAVGRCRRRYVRRVNTGEVDDGSSGKDVSNERNIIQLILALLLRRVSLTVVTMASGGL